MDIETASKCLSELGNPHRLEAFRLLIKAGPEGVTVGDIQKHLNIPKSTLSHHISHLVWAGLAKQEREGRVLRCTANFALADALVSYLCAECCSGLDVVQLDETQDV
jgi:ArsR family transcriptional regulator, arsenate/arsenite/antimonite-responsive transcriptional repressor